MLAVHRAAVVGHSRECGGALRVAADLVRRAVDLEVRVAFVVAKQDVEPGVQRLDQVVLQQQRLGFGAHDGGLHAHDTADHVADAGAAMVLLEIARDALFQVAGLAHVKHAAIGVEITVDARQRRQRRDLGQQLFGMRI